MGRTSSFSSSSRTPTSKMLAQPMPHARSSSPFGHGREGGGIAKVVEGEAQDVFLGRWPPFHRIYRGFESASRVSLACCWVCIGRSGDLDTFCPSFLTLSLAHASSALALR